MSDGMATAGFQVTGSDVVRRPEYRHPLVLKDIRAMVAADVGTVAWLHGSPPCNRFSTARAGRKLDPPTDADTDLLRAFLDLRDSVAPQFWSVENVRGAVKFFEPYLGRPRLRHGAFQVWGNFPGFLVGEARMVKGFTTYLRHDGKRMQFPHTAGKDSWARSRLPESLTVPMARAIAAAL